ncbi:MAG TPA: flagellar filament capping protein FliD [Oxalicibacterium sp.]|uniref:flagellar filament capping protein FliD n=1 Tax=Oxalicibacterium sp. TaxID=2766525 RepID=UPI002C7ED9E3|nr:flagellar filament capping protein FliD [Oxalicibacterium sp.]HWU98471.1 flagellar filament capping protein FliD [Oxalicibacterium sp.]
MATGSVSSTLGAGSGLPLDDLLTKLMTAESQPLISLQQKEASYQAQLSAYGNLSGVLSTFQTAMSKLGQASAFQGLKTNIGDDDFFTATTSDKAVGGNYRVNVTQLSQAQILTSAGQTGRTAPIGSGQSTTISFQFGTISGGTLANGKYTGATFNQNADQESGTITIDSSNNSLQGIRDAINAAKMGVTATLVSDGSATPDRLVITSNETGQQSSMKITVDGDPALQNLLGYDPTSTQNMSQTSAAQDAKLTVNDIAITSPTNAVEEAIQGVTLNLSKVGETSLSITKDTSAVQANINAFVKAYNDLNTALKAMTAYTPSKVKGQKGTGGPLVGDATTRTIQDSIRKTLTTSLEGLSNSSISLSSIGVAFQKDGSLAVDSTKLTKALANNFDDIGALFATVGKPTDSLINFNTSGPQTKAGTYAINITQLATQATLKGDVDLNAGNTVIAANTEISVKIDGVEAKVALTAGSYNAKQLAAMVQSAINGSSKLSSANVSVSTSVDADGHLNVVSDRYGSASNITITDGTGTSAATLFGAVTTGTVGVDVAGTIGGQAATGSGQMLTAAKGTNADGLKLEITGGSLGNRGSVDFSQGYADRLDKLLDGYLGSDGLIGGRTDGINRSIGDIDDQADKLNVRLAAVEANYRAQFTALDALVASMNTTSNYLSQQLASLANLSSQSI